MDAVKEEFLTVLEEMPQEKINILLRFAEWLSEEDELTPDEMAALSKGEEQFDKGEYVFFSDIKRG